MIFSEKLKFIEKNIKAKIISNLKFISEVRNCLMHNNGLADQRLLPKYQVGQKISFSSIDVHNYGVEARALAQHIWSELK